MNKARLAAQSRSQLDERFRELGPAKRYTPPVRGWIKALREAFGMSTAQTREAAGDQAAFPGSARTIGSKGHHRAGDITPRSRGARLHACLCTRAQQTAGNGKLSETERER